MIDSINHVFEDESWVYASDMVYSAGQTAGFLGDWDLFNILMDMSLAALKIQLSGNICPQLTDYTEDL